MITSCINQPIHHELESVTSLLACVVGFLLCLVVIFVFCLWVLLLLWCFALFRFVLLCCHRDSTQDYVSVLYQFTFEATQPQMVYVCHN